MELLLPFARPCTISRRMGLPTVLLDMLDGNVAVNDDGDKTPLHSNVSLTDAQRLYDLVRSRRPEVTVEIGFAQGISALAIAQALEDNGCGTHHVVDPFENSLYEGVGLTSLDRAGLRNRVVFYEGFVEDVVPSLPCTSFAFIDASHLFDLTLMDFILVDKRLDIGGLIGFHDLWLPGVLKAVRYIVTNRDYRVYGDVPSQPTPTKWQVGNAVVKRIPRAELVLRPEVMELSADLDLNRMMTFVEKLSGDTRSWDFYRSF
jgi:predicted O-methyltransferase YrrM